MSEEKPPSRPFFQRLFNKFFHKTLKPRAQLMQALEEAEDNLVYVPYSRSVIEGAMQVESLKVRDVMVRRSKMIMIDSEAFAGAGSGGSDRYLSEDYMFCQFTRKIGISTWLCPWMKLGHVGSYVFNGTLPALGNLDFAAHGNDMESRPHNISKEEEKEAEKAAGKTLSRAERRKAARKNRKKKK